LGDQSEKNEVDGACSTYGREERRVQVLAGKPEGKRYLEDPGIDGRIIRGTIVKWDRGAWTGLIWLRIGTGGGLL
jgi:hypothetical protein